MDHHLRSPVDGIPPGLGDDAQTDVAPQDHPLPEPPEEKLTGYLLYHLVTKDPAIYTLVSRLIRRVCLRCGEGFPDPIIGYEGARFHPECAQKTGDFLLTLSRLLEVP